MKNAAHPSYCHCCELCALKQKPGVLLSKTRICVFRTHILIHTYSQLQTVLITASGPQASNALVHRERYTQGSRQNRCLSSQEALALRAKVKGNREGQCPLVGGRLVTAVRGLASCAHCRRPFSASGRLPFRGGCAIFACLPLAPSLVRVRGVKNRGRVRLKNCQLRTAYGGESNCIIKT